MTKRSSKRRTSRKKAAKAKRSSRILLPLNKSFGKRLLAATRTAWMQTMNSPKWRSGPPVTPMEAARAVRMHRGRILATVGSSDSFADDLRHRLSRAVGSAVYVNYDGGVEIEAEAIGRALGYQI
jgi:hypothetical protein